MSRLLTGLLALLLSLSCAGQTVGPPPAVSGSGTVTSVASGNGLTGGPITTTGTLAVSASTCNSTGNALTWTGTAFGCATGYAPLASPSFTGNVTGAGAFLAGTGTGYKINTTYVLRDDISTNTAVGSGAGYVTTNAASNLTVGHNAGVALTDLATNKQNVFSGASSGSTLNMPGTGGVVAVTASGGVIGSCSITAAGSGYTQVPITDLSVGNGSNGVLTITLSGGALSTCAVASAGTGYSSSFNATLHGIDSNVAVGYQSMQASGHGGWSMWRNVCIGYECMQGSYNEYGSIGIGYDVMTSANGGDFNVIIGDGAAPSLTTGSANTCIGRACLNAATTATYDVGLGHATLFALTTGQLNTAVGDIACDVEPVTGSGDTCIGEGTTMTGDYTNSTVIGIGASASASHQVVLGTSAENVIMPGHRSFIGTAPAVSACGGSPSIDTHATDSSGTVTFGSAATSCTITFNAAYVTWAHCTVGFESALAAEAYSYTTSAMTITATALSGKADYVCDGQ